MSFSVLSTHHHHFIHYFSQPLHTLTLTCPNTFKSLRSTLPFICFLILTLCFTFPFHSSSDKYKFPKCLENKENSCYNNHWYEVVLNLIKLTKRAYTLDFYFFSFMKTFAVQIKSLHLTFQSVKFFYGRIRVLWFWIIESHYSVPLNASTAFFNGTSISNGLLRFSKVWSEWGWRKITASWSETKLSRDYFLGNMTSNNWPLIFWVKIMR